ncbi:MAG: SulP family sulfate permease [Patiriisocius sp.]
MKENILSYLSPNNWRLDTLSGITVALALVPEAIAFAFVAGVDPIVGLYAAAIVSFTAALLSGRPGMISGATGALAVVMVELVRSHGVEYLFATVVLMGLIQLAVAFFRLGKFSRIIPYPVMLGFVNGLAIVIFFAQIPQLQAFTPAGHFGWMHGQWLPSSELFLMLSLIALTMAVITFLPRFTKAIPSSLASISLVTLIVVLFDLNTPTVLDMLKGSNMNAGFPTFAIPDVPFSFATLSIIFPFAIVLAFIGLVESLMTMTLIDEKTDTRGKSNVESSAQGIANVITGFFGGMGGCAMVGQSMINMNSGGRGRWAGIVAGLSLFAFILFAGSLIEIIPLAALVGVMFMVVAGTFAWSSFRIIRKIPMSDAFVLILVSATTVLYDLAIAVIVGIVVSALVFSWKKSQSIEAKTFLDKKGSKHYELNGNLYFASVQSFSQIFTVAKDPAEVFIDFRDARIMDHSAIEAVNALTDKYLKSGKKLHLYHLSHDCRRLLKNAEKIVEVNVEEDPVYEVADDQLDSR